MTSGQDFDDVRHFVYASQGWVCEVCEMPLLLGHHQLAHRIPQNVAMIERYGEDVIHHRMNLVGVDSLRCNDAVSISNQPKAIEALVSLIRKDLERNSHASFRTR